MRIVSQNGRIDIPYENRALVIYDNGSEFEIESPILSSPDDEDRFILGTFKSIKKAESVMQQIRKAYTQQRTDFFETIFTIPKDREDEQI